MQFQQSLDIFKSICSNIKDNKIWLPRIPYKHTPILRFFLYSQTFMLLPFFIAELAISFNANLSTVNSQLCVSVPTDYNGYNQLTLGSWLYIDGSMKLAVWAMVLFLNLLETQIKCKGVALVICANFLRLYYIVEFCWSIAGSQLFWGTNGGNIDRTWIYCKGTPYNGYMWFLLLFTYFTLPFNLYISGYRSKYIEDEDYSMVLSKNQKDLENTDRMIKQEKIAE